MHIQEFQERIEKLYLDRDRDRGIERTFAWFVEEVGELAKAINRKKDDGGKNLREEFADVLAWLVTLASLHGISVEDAAEEKYGKGCPKCGGTPCHCPKA